MVMKSSEFKSRRQDTSALVKFLFLTINFSDNFLGPIALNFSPLLLSLFLKKQLKQPFTYRQQQHYIIMI